MLFKKKRNSDKDNDKSIEFPEELVDQCFMIPLNNAVNPADGHSYDEHCYKCYVEVKDRDGMPLLSPTTGASMDSSNYYINVNLRKSIHRLLEEQSADDILLPPKEVEWQKLKEAIKENALDRVKQMVESNDYFLELPIHQDQSTFFYACCNGDEAIVSYLLTKLNHDELVQAITADQRTIIHQLVNLGKESAVKLLHTIEAFKPCFEKCDEEGLLPIHIAVMNADLAMSKCLLALGADSHLSVAASSLKWLPIHYAADSGNSSLLKLILHHSAEGSLSKQDRLGRLPFHIACLSGSESCVKTLLYFIYPNEKEVVEQLSLCYNADFTQLISLMLSAFYCNYQADIGNTIQAALNKIIFSRIFLQLVEDYSQHKDLYYKKLENFNELLEKLVSNDFDAESEFFNFLQTTKSFHIRRRFFVDTLDNYTFLRDSLANMSFEDLKKGLDHFSNYLTASITANSEHANVVTAIALSHALGVEIDLQERISANYDF